jgi:drug/metabolite transporter (DMT)-like permease
MPSENHRKALDSDLDKIGIPMSESDDRSIDPFGLLNLAIVYVVWGSTYLAIRIAVREGAGFPPFTMVLMRVSAAGLVMLAWSKLRGYRIRLKRSELLTVAGSGLLLWTTANGLVTWAEQRADSALAALIVASVPIWTALLGALLDRRAPSLRLILALFVGFAGIGFLSYPSLRTGSVADSLAVLGLLAASLAWAAGTQLQRRRLVAVKPQVSAAYQSLIGGMGFLPLILISQEPKPTPTLQAWFAWGYLVVFGSILGFTAFVQAVSLLPTNIAMTYAYVNPVLAVILGAVILDEAITIWTVTGAVLVLLGVAGVFHERTSGRIGARLANRRLRSVTHHDP